MALSEVLKKILSSKINIELYNMVEKSMNQSKIDQVIVYASEIFVNFVESVLTSFPELKSSGRDIFREIIYSDVQRAEGQATTTDKQETEVMKLSDLISKIDDQLYPNTLTQSQVVCL